MFVAILILRYTRFRNIILVLNVSQSIHAFCTFFGCWLRHCYQIELTEIFSHFIFFIPFFEAVLTIFSILNYLVQKVIVVLSMIHKKIRLKYSIKKSSRRFLKVLFNCPFLCLSRVEMCIFVKEIS